MWCCVGDDGQLTESDALLSDRAPPGVIRSRARELGTVFVKIEHRTVEAVLDPYLIEPIPQIALLYLIADHSFAHIRLIGLDEYQIAGRAEVVIPRLNKFITEARAATEARFHASSAMQLAGPLVRTLHREFSTKGMTKQVREILKTHFSDRFGILERDRNDEFYLEELGEGQAIMRSWANRQSIPMLVRHLPDVGYGRWFSKQLSSLFSNNKPAAQKVHLKIFDNGSKRLVPVQSYRYFLPSRHPDLALIVTKAITA